MHENKEGGAGPHAARRARTQERTRQGHQASVSVCSRLDGAAAAITEERGDIVAERDPLDGHDGIAHEVHKRPVAQPRGPRDQKILPHLLRQLLEACCEARVGDERRRKEDTGNGWTEDRLAQQGLEQCVCFLPRIEGWSSAPAVCACAHV
jgi:hypothetical protein